MIEQMGLLFLPILGGYWFSRLFLYTRYVAEQHDGERLIFYSSSFALFLLLLTRFTILEIADSCPSLVAFKAEYLPIEYSGTAIATAFAGPFIAFVLNILLVITFVEPRLYHQAVRRHGDELEMLLHYAQKNSISLFVTLKSGKVYVGAVTGIPADLSREKNHIRIAVQRSGVRDPEDKQVKLEVSYVDKMKKMYWVQDTTVKDVSPQNSGPILRAWSNIKHWNRLDRKAEEYRSFGLLMKFWVLTVKYPHRLYARVFQNHNGRIPSVFDKVFHKDEIEICALWDANLWASFRRPKIEKAKAPMNSTE